MIRPGSTEPPGRSKRTVNPRIGNLSVAVSAVKRPSSLALSDGVTARMLSDKQIESIRSAMLLFVEDDLARGVSAGSRIYCDACERPRPAAGLIKYERYVLCNVCAVEYEVARARGLVATAGRYVRDKHFGEGDGYALVESPAEAGSERADKAASAY